MFLISRAWRGGEGAGASEISSGHCSGTSSRPCRKLRICGQLEGVETQPQGTRYVPHRQQRTLFFIMWGLSTIQLYLVAINIDFSGGVSELSQVARSSTGAAAAAVIFNLERETRRNTQNLAASKSTQPSLKTSVFRRRRDRNRNKYLSFP